MFWTIPPESFIVYFPLSMSPEMLARAKSKFEVGLGDTTTTQMEQALGMVLLSILSQEKEFEIKPVMLVSPVAGLVQRRGLKRTVWCVVVGG